MHIRQDDHPPGDQSIEILKSLRSPQALLQQSLHDLLHLENSETVQLFVWGKSVPAVLALPSPGLRILSNSVL
ncbi:hypothetical protein VTN49DRAFT_195 [Thermomyces lanuginosus]|uniref:uncharacterized protein n=1 Tax=Thermomyces lanuginosus TaxID=5541 RepID=UPI003743DBFA